MPFLIDFFTSEISEISHKCPFGLVIASLRVSGYTASKEIGILHSHWISSSSCSTTTVMSLVYLVTLYFPSITMGIVELYKVSNFLSAFNNLSHADVCVLESFLWYVNSDDLVFCSSPHFLPHKGLHSQEACILILTWKSYITIYLELNQFFSNRGTSTLFPLGLSFSIPPT